jgi:hypothetical protein
LRFNAEQEENAESTRKYVRKVSDLNSEKEKLLKMRGKGGSDNASSGALEAQYEALTRELDAVIAENKVLRSNAKNGNNGGSNNSFSSNHDGSFDNGGNANGGGGSGGGEVSSGLIRELRSEFEGKIGRLNEEKRELVMKHSGLVSDLHQAEKRALRSEEESEKIKESMMSLRLQLERLESRNEMRGEQEEDNDKENLTLNKVNSSASSSSSSKKKNQEMKGAKGAVFEKDGNRGGGDSLGPILSASKNVESAKPECAQS